MPDARRRTKPNVIILYNENPDWPAIDLQWSNEMLDAMTQGLREQGYTFEPVKFFDDLSALDDYDPRAWLVWNWGEELAGRPWSEAEVAAELERRGFAFTGSPSTVFPLLQNRMAVKQRLAEAGLPTLPARVFTAPAAAAEWTHFPAIVKGLSQHASYGIDGNSVVGTPEELAARVVYLREHFNDDSLVEPFLDSREFHVAVWGNDHPTALPPMEFDYGVFSDMRDRLYTYAAKFDRHSRGFNEIKMVCPAPADRPDWRARLEEVAVGAYACLGLRDYGRIDMRMQGDEPMILDVNANPDLDLTSVLTTGAQQIGLNFGQMADRILTFAAERLPAPRRPRTRRRTTARA